VAKSKDDSDGDAVPKEFLKVSPIYTRCCS
jgi:hypothetical protein